MGYFYFEGLQPTESVVEQLIHESLKGVLGLYLEKYQEARRPREYPGEVGVEPVQTPVIE